MSAQIIQTMAFTQIMVILTSWRSVEDNLKVEKGGHRNTSYYGDAFFLLNSYY